jgi:biotin operon repressor
MTSHARIYRTDSRRKLSPTAWQVITELRRCLRYGEEAAISNAELARRLDRSEGTISEAMKRLEAEGLIARRHLGTGLGYAVSLVQPPELAQPSEEGEGGAEADTPTFSDPSPTETDPPIRVFRSPHPLSTCLAAAAARASRQAIQPITLTDEEQAPMSKPQAPSYRPRPQAAETFCTIAEWRRLMRVATQPHQTDEWVVAQFEAAKARRTFQNLVAVVYRACQDDEPITTVEELAAKAEQRKRELEALGPVIVESAPAAPQEKPRREKVSRPAAPPIAPSLGPSLDKFSGKAQLARFAAARMSDVSRLGMGSGEQNGA